MELPIQTPFYEVDKKEEDENVDDYDAVLFTVCDVIGRPRGKFAVGDGIQKYFRDGLDMPLNTCVLGYKNEPPSTLPQYNKSSGMTCRIFPDVSTLRPLSWLCKDGKKVGHVLCDMYNSKGHHALSSPRNVALRQLEALRSLGFQIMTAHETEFFVFHKGTLNPLGGDVIDIQSMCQIDAVVPFLYTHMEETIASGIPVECQMREFSPGQIELSMQPQYGITMADCIHRLRYVSKAVCDRHGFKPTFMTRPSDDHYSSGYHLNHSLWTLDGKNAFYDPNDDHKCSEMMYHWVAGLIHHGHALVALMCPTMNCFLRLVDMLAPGENVWNFDDRNARIRVKTTGTNIYVEERLPSAASNPYLCLAGLVAAGIDGVMRKLECPPRAFRPTADCDEFKSQDPLPRSLEEALQALENDTVLTSALGHEFVQEYVALAREFQVEKLKDLNSMESEEKMKVMREMYFHSL